MQQFINNHTRITKTKGHCQKLDLSGKKKSIWQPYQAFSHLYYEKRGLGPIIKREYEEYIAAALPDTKVKELFAFHNRQLHEMLAVAGDDIKQEVKWTRQKGVTVKQEEALKKMLDEGMSEDEYCKMKRKM